MKRVPTGIPGLDQLIEGGFIEGSSVLISGGPGTGKTIFCMQYIYKGAELYNEPGILITFEEGRQNLWWNMQAFKWNVAKLQEQDLIDIYQVGRIEPYEFAKRFDEEIERIKELVESKRAKRLAIDSTTAFSMWMRSESEIRYSLFKLVDEMKKLGTTTLLTAETRERRYEYSRFGVEEFIVDGVIVLYFFPPMRYLFVRKMRGTNHDLKIHPYRITNTGIIIDATEEVLWESLNRYFGTER